MKGDGATDWDTKIYHVTNTESVRRRVSIPRDSIKRVSLPQHTMQSMLNRITINCINSKNSRDSKHRPSAHNRCMHRETDVNWSTLHFLFANILCRKFMGFTRDHQKSRDLPPIAIFYFYDRKLCHL